MLNLVVIRSADLDRAEQFYASIGLSFTRHSHGNGPEHLANECDGIVFEIYPRTSKTESTAGTRIGFRVECVETATSSLAAIGAMIQSLPKDSPWGRRAVVLDFDGHQVELTSKLNILTR
ncbi:Glyoxalase-like domain protein [Pirellulimonas nuda]|uniref:Glyoxalase-like domain protein n=1 Tax=Pirellulimonas nuda TaxID=2528009 RepID=A0A518D758_9BACT|nr:VOC family protein [Pirellulimonas nuda]QDU87291.1 Glyoxalase-like domain protein [Pirellulimonas nuda]